jgi:hypothetical protein
VVRAMWRMPAIAFLSRLWPFWHDRIGATTRRRPMGTRTSRPG